MYEVYFGTVTEAIEPQDFGLSHTPLSHKSIYYIKYYTEFVCTLDCHRKTVQHKTFWAVKQAIVTQVQTVCQTLHLSYF